MIVFSSGLHGRPETSGPFDNCTANPRGAIYGCRLHNDYIRMQLYGFPFIPEAIDGNRGGGCIG